MTDKEVQKTGSEQEVPEIPMKEFLNTFMGKGRYSPDPYDRNIYPQTFYARGEGEDIPVKRITFNPKTDIEGEEVREIDNPVEDH